MMNQFTRLKGTEDIYGSEALGFERVEVCARSVFKIFAFEELRTPHLEARRLFTHALGTGTDVVQKEMYEFLDKSEDYVALRPEGTAGIVRAYLENNFHKTQPFSKFFYLGPMFRRERPQKGRLRQFHQIGAEILGTSSPYADAEAIQCLTALLDALGITGYRLKMNNLGTFAEREKYRKELHDFFGPHVGVLCEDCQNRYHANKLFRILDCKVEACRNIVFGVPPISTHLTSESGEHFTKVKEILSSARIHYLEDRYMVRGLDYYTKTVFEFSHPKLGAQDAFAAGGRYDALVESLGGPSVGAVGFAAGLERLLLCMASEDGSGKKFERFFMIATMGEAAFAAGFRILTELRRAGVPSAMDFHGKSFKSQMRLADKTRSRYVVILGDDELKKNTLILKNMETGSQEGISLEGVVSELKKRSELC